MDTPDYLRFVGALAFVLALIGLLGLALKAAAARGMMRGGQPGDRLSVSEIKPIDGRRRLVLVRRDDVEHLLLLSPDRETVVESGIPVASATTAHKSDDGPSLEAGS
ncbi:MAG: hypothetical protein Alpg2KO_11710 [Alphaproteobacteria bacterium]